MTTNPGESGSGPRPPEAESTDARGSGPQASSPQASGPQLSGGQTLGREVQDHLGELLRAALDDVAQEPVPERFRALVADLERVLAERGQVVDAGLRAEILAIVPNLRAFAYSLARDMDRADDLVQDTLLRALRNLDKFEKGTNIAAWLFTIARNQFHTDWRRRRREVEDPDERLAGQLSVAPEQIDKVTFQDLRAALAKLTPDHREALLLVAAEGRSIEEAARVLGVPEGTIKSRVHRARVRLAEFLGIEDAGDIGVDRVTRAALG